MASRVPRDRAGDHPSLRPVVYRSVALHSTLRAGRRTLRALHAPRRRLLLSRLHTRCSISFHALYTRRTGQAARATSAAASTGPSRQRAHRALRPSSCLRGRNPGRVAPSISPAHATGPCRRVARSRPRHTSSSHRAQLLPTWLGTSVALAGPCAFLDVACASNLFVLDE